MGRVDGTWVGSEPHPQPSGPTPRFTGICQCSPGGRAGTAPRETAGGEGRLEKEPVDRPLPAQKSHQEIKDTGRSLSWL